MKNSMGSLTFLISTLVTSHAAFACDLCSVYSESEVSGRTRAGEYFAGTAEQFTHFGTLRNEGAKIENSADQFLDSSITQLFVGRNFSPDFALQLNVPVIYRSYRRTTDEGGTEQGTANGMGDAVLLAKYRVLDTGSDLGSYRVHVQGGLQLPTGSTDRLREEFSEGATDSGVHGHDLTLGSGAYHFILGVESVGRMDRWSVEANAQYAIRLKGRFDYRFGNDLHWGIAPGYALYRAATSTVTGALDLNGEIKDRDTLNGIVAEDTGITSLFLGPKLSANLGESLTALIALDFPVVSDNTALQIVPSSRVRAALTMQF